MNFKELEKQAEQWFKTENPSQLAIRKENLRIFIRDMKIEPAESIEEKIARKQPYNNLFKRFTEVINQKTQEERTKSLERERAWALEELPKHIQPVRALRYLAGAEVQSLRQGISRVEQCRWQPVTDLKFTIKSSKGRNIQIDMNRIHPKLIRHMLEDPLTTLFLKTPDVILLRKGNPISGIWNHFKEFGKTKDDEPVFQQTYIAFRCV